MTTPVDKEDWTALIEVLDRATKQLAMKRLEPVKLSILEFISTAAMLELQDMADVGQKFNDFLLKTVAPRWDNEAVATLSFSVGALVEKMQMSEYGPKFSSGLDEVLLYLDFYEGESDSVLPVSDAPEAVEKLESVEEDIAIEEQSPVEEAVQIEENIAVVAEQDEEEKVLTIEEIELEESIEPPLEMTPLHEPEPAIQIGASAFSLPDSDEIGYVIDIDEETGYVVDAIEWYKEILITDPTSQAFCLLAEELCLRRQWREAIDVCKKGLRFHPQHLRGRILLGWALSESGEVENARETLQGARKELERNAIVYRVLAEMEEKEGNNAEAEKLMALYRQLGSEQDYESFTPAYFDEAPLADIPIPPTPPERPKPIVKKKPTAAAVPTPKESPVVKLLSGMLEKFLQKPEADEEKKTIFSAPDRSSIKDILRAALH